MKGGGAAALLFAIGKPANERRSVSWIGGLLRPGVVLVSVLVVVVVVAVRQAYLVVCSSVVPSLRVIIM